MSNPLILKLKKLISDLSIDTENNTSDIEDINTSVANNTSDIQKLKGTVLYESTGSNSTSLTLSDNISNYKEYEVFYSLRTENGEANSVRCLVGRSAILTGAISGYFDNSYYGTRLYAGRCSISGNKLTKVIGYNFSFKTDGAALFNDTRNEIYIHKVIGYKE